MEVIVEVNVIVTIVIARVKVAVNVIVTIVIVRVNVVIQEKIVLNLNYILTT